MTSEPTGRELPGASPFAGDDGSADEELARLLADHAAGHGSLVDVVARLAEVRVLVPVLAQLESAGEGEHGLTVDKEASAGVVALEAPDGRRALPVFTSVAAMTAWRPDARPVPTDAVRAALSAVSEGWALLVVDPAGPATALVPRPAVWSVAQGRTWVPAVSGGVVDPAVEEAIVSAVSPVPSVAKVRAEPGRTAEVAVVLAIDPGLTRARLDVVLAEVNAALAGSDVVSERVDGLELRIGRAS
ncbi:SseB family protein [Sanguibacter suaedae]|uniref:SseB family protein n=1 Tax=Sanguibacter suaedae TaxID=2795737 RepID=A0A934MA68_9MICO|nr:SseB family protein [Sanguibacter suaedae]MBI9115438.1 SseB family protein [Sanguibacter suaedae]